MLNRNFVGQWSEAIRRLFSLKDAGPIAVAPEFQSTVDVWATPDFGALIRQHRWGGGPTSGAAVANNSGVGIRNPTGSGLLCVVEGFRCTSAVGAGTDLRIRAQAATGVTGTTSAVHLDTRFWRPGTTVDLSAILFVLYQNNGALGQNIATYNGAAGEEPKVPFPVMLAPGAEVILWSATQNLAITVNWFGHARPATAEELQAV